MSHPNRAALYQRPMSLAGIDTRNITDDELSALVRKTLKSKIHGISFSPYVAGQGPGTQVSEEQIRERLSIIAPYVRWIRTFSCTDGNEAIGRIAHEMGLKTMIGAWIDGDREKNELEIANAIEVAQAGHANIVAVGNEVLLRGELSDDELIDSIHQVKDAVSGIPVGYVDAYFEFVDHPAVTDACDVILANCYPFWEGCAAEYAILYMKDMYRRASSVANGKKVIVSETGWPDKGTPFGAAVPGRRNAIQYFLGTYKWAEEDDIEVFYFSSFDEAWKVDAEGDVGAYWGLWNSDGQPKYY